MPLPPLSLLSHFTLPFCTPSLTLFSPSVLFFLPCLFYSFASCPLSVVPLPSSFYTSIHPGYTLLWYSLCIYHFGSHSGLRAECSCSLCPYCQLCNGAHDIYVLKASSVVQFFFFFKKETILNPHGMVLIFAPEMLQRERCQCAQLWQKQ